MADLSPQQEETLDGLRADGFEQVAMKLEGLFEQIRERPDDAQIAELISNMLRQYIAGYEPRSFHVADTVWGSEVTIKPNGSEQPKMVATFVPIIEHCAEGAPGLLTGDQTNLPLGPGGSTFTPIGAAPKPEAKPPLHLVPFGFIIAMAKVMQEGIRGDRKAHGWKDLDAAELEERRGALLRHYGEGEWASVATNAAILWWHSQEGSR